MGSAFAALAFMLIGAAIGSVVMVFVASHRNFTKPAWEPYEDILRDHDIPREHWDAFAVFLLAPRVGGKTFVQCLDELPNYQNAADEALDRKTERFRDILSSTTRE